MVSLLTSDEIKQMRQHLEDNPPLIGPPKGREYWDVYRIVATLESYKYHQEKVVNVEKFCVKCLHEVFCDTTENHWCCECFATRTVYTDEFDLCLEFVPHYWIETDTIPQMIDELRALRNLREVCGMYCERLPVEVRETLHAIPEIEKSHSHNPAPNNPL